MKRTRYPTPTSRDVKGCNGSSGLVPTESGFHRLTSLLPNYVAFVLERLSPSDTGGGIEAMEIIEAERRKVYGEVPVSDSDSQ